MNGFEKSKRRQEKLDAYNRRREITRQRMEKYADDILESYNFRKTEKYMQHGSVSVRRHCLSVAECSILIGEWLKERGISYHEREMVRGALLHDYFLYDWHGRVGGDHKRLHGFFHPAVALRNAGREYELTDRERDIIAKHMWPLTIKPPACREAWIVTAADKYCSMRETLFCRKGGR